MKKVFFIAIVLLFIGSQISLGANANGYKKAGDDPGTTIKSDTTISSRQLVELPVTLAASAGKLEEDGHINVTIPKEVVANKQDILNELYIETPFSLDSNALTEDENGNYILSVQYDHTQIDTSSAVGQTFIVKFKAPKWYADDLNLPDKVNFTSTLYKGNQIVSSDKTTSTLLKDPAGLPLLKKRSTQAHKIIDGESVAMMSQNRPSSNVFAILVNYNGETIPNAKLTDITPSDTTLVDPDKYIPASGDNSTIQHIRIAKVTSRDSNGVPISWEYVTQEFQDKIQTKTDGFSIDFGNLTPKDSYVVMYAEKVDSTISAQKFGVRYNTAKLLSGDSLLRTSSEALGLDYNDYNYTALTKTVEQKSIATSQGNLTYSLNLQNIKGVVPAGTKIIDVLPEHTSFVKTVQRNSDYISRVEYQKDSNTVTYTLLKDLEVGRETVVKFQAYYNNPMAKPGYKIHNRAYISYAGSDIYSNDATTINTSSAYLYKTDGATNNPLPGAVFDIVDNNGKIAVSHITSDNQGKVATGVLSPGAYSFVEVMAPKGYALDQTKIPFIIKEGDTAPISLQMSNVKAISISGQKSWDDNGDKAHERPESILIKLYRNGQWIDQKRVTKAEGWMYSFNGLPSQDGNGNKYQYTVKEEKVEHYLTIQNGYNFTNMYVPEPIKPVINPNTMDIPKTIPANMKIMPKKNKEKHVEVNKLPQTGDQSSRLPLFAMALISLGAILLLKKK